VEDLTQEDGTGSLICLEVNCDGPPETVGGLIRLHSEVEDLISDKAVQPAADAEVHLAPLIGVQIGCRSAVDVRDKAELPAQELKEGFPLGVVRRSELQLDGGVRQEVDGGIIRRHRIAGDVVEDVVEEVGEGETDGVVGIVSPAEEASAVTQDINRSNLLRRTTP
jgi:hypothetical protein